MLRRLISCRIIIIIINTIRAAKTDKRHSMSCVTAVQGINRKPQPIMRLPISLRLYHFRDIVSTSHLHFLLTRETKYRTCVIRGHWSKICIFSPFFLHIPSVSFEALARRFPSHLWYERRWYIKKKQNPWDTWGWKRESHGPTAISFDALPACDGQTDTQTEGHDDYGLKSRSSTSERDKMDCL